MAWERRTRAAATYYSEARRDGPKVVKVYLGSRAAARADARAVAERQAERTRAALAASQVAARLRPAEVLLDRQFSAVMGHATAVLYGAGYRRPSRHGWRVWREALRVLRAAG
jgi:hypothetical protein